MAYNKIDSFAKAKHSALRFNELASYITLIRHGTTQSNMQGRFVGNTDDPITEQSAEECRRMAKQHPYPVPQAIYISPMLRCRQTMEAVYGGGEPIVLNGLKEMDFGEAEYMVATEALDIYNKEAFLQRRPDFGFPGGETFGQLFDRAANALDRIAMDIAEKEYSSVGVVTHTLVIDAILRNSLEQRLSVNDLYCPNGFGIGIWLEPEEWLQKRVTRFDGYLPDGATRPGLEESTFANTFK